MGVAARTSLLALLVSVLVTGCNNLSERLPAPLEPTADSVSHFCGMLLAEHPGPKGQIFIKGRPKPVWFSSVSETMAYTMLPEEPASVAAVYVNDMSKAKNWGQPEPGTWVDARRAWYVLGSDKLSPAGMGDIHREPIPFGDETAAERFQAAHGGRIVRFAEIPQDDILGSGTHADRTGNVRHGLGPASRNE